MLVGVNSISYIAHTLGFSVVAGAFDVSGILTEALGLGAVAGVGCLLALTTWIRLLVWQRISSMALQTLLTHVPVIGVVAWATGFNFAQLLCWDAAICAACYISYCAYLGYSRTAQLAALRPSRFSTISRAEYAGELVLAFLDSLVFRAVYSWSDLSPEVSHFSGRRRTTPR